MRRALTVIAILVLVLLVGVGIWAYTPDESRAALDAKYSVSPADYVEIAGLRLHVRDTGPKSASAVVLLHGFGSSLETWDAWADNLSGDYHVIRYDLPGFGLTGADPTGDYSDERGMQILAALLDHLGVGRAALIGNSMGGKLAWKFAEHYPARVTKLVLISPDGFASPGFEYGKAPKVPAMLKVLPYTLPKPLLRMNLVVAYSDPAALDDKTVTRYWDMMRAPGVRSAVIVRLGQTILDDPEPLLRRITAPTLILWGEKDGMIPFANAADYQRDITTSRLVALPDLGHVPQEEAPAASLKPVRAFLAECQGCSSAPGSSP